MARTSPLGSSLGEVVNVLMIAVVLFLCMVTCLGWLMQTKHEEATNPPPPTPEHVLLTETRDLVQAGVYSDGEHCVAPRRACTACAGAPGKRGPPRPTASRATVPRLALEGVRDVSLYPSAREPAHGGKSARALRSVLPREARRPLCSTRGQRSPLTGALYPTPPPVAQSLH